MRERFPLPRVSSQPYSLFIGTRGAVATDAGADQFMEGPMQLRVGLNVAAAIMSFAFLAAVVLGMV